MKLVKFILLLITLIFVHICPFIINKTDMIVKAKLCRICYSKTTKFNISKNKMFNIYDRYIYINKKATKSVCYIFYNKHQIDVCFKGTSTLTDICFNLDIYPKIFIDDKIRIHTGFLNKYLSLKDDIKFNVDKIIKTNEIKQLSFNGYSAGGAIANIASLEFSYIYNIPINCITFGAPRVGNIHFIDKYNSRNITSLRIINKNDIIPSILPPIIYRHIHNPLIIENKYNYWSLNIYSFFRYAHSIITYIKNLY